MQPGPFQPRYEDLPEELPLFPLRVLLLPRGRLPLNIFEPRYLAMTEHALGAGRLIGMIQPRGEGDEDDLPEVPELYEVGCCGRISSFAETDDGRFVLTLTGVARFRLVEELPLTQGFRRARVDFGAFSGDLEPAAPPDYDRDGLVEALGDLFAAHSMPFNSRMVEGLGSADLIDTMSMVVPLDPAEKQALLEAPTPAERAEVLQACLEMARFPGGGKPQ